MDDFDGIFLFIVGAVVAILVFMGVVTAIKKSFTNNENPTLVDQSIIDQSRRKAQDTKDQQKMLMEQQRQRLKDSQRLRN